MADNTDVAVYDVVQLLEGVDHTVAKATVQLADALVDEEEVGGDALQREIGESQSKCDRDEEAFAAGDHFDRSRGIA